MADAQLPKWTDPRYQEKLAELWPHNASSDEFFKKDYRAKHDWHQSLTYEHWDYVEPFEFLELPADLRQRILEFALGVSWSGIQPAPPKPSYLLNPGEKPRVVPRIPFSATAALRTLSFHARSIKAVCADVAADVRVLERTVAKPTAWLAGLWQYDLPTSTPPAFVLARCRERATAAGRANVAAQMWGRLGAYGGGRETVVKCPAPWPKRQVEGVKHIWVEGQPVEGWDDGPDEDSTLAWAHVRCRTAEETHAMPPVDGEFLKSMCREAFSCFTRSFREVQWRVAVHSVRIVYRGDFIEDGDGRRGRARGTGADVETLEAELANLFGAERMRASPWIQEWCNNSHSGYHASVREKHIQSGKHDPTRPTVTRIRDVKDASGQTSIETINDGSFPLTWTSFDSHVDPKSVATTFDLIFSPFARAEAQDDSALDGDEGPGPRPPKPPSFMFIGPVASALCHTGRRICRADVSFKLKVDVKNNRHDRAILFVPIVPGVFHALCDSTVIGLN